MLDYKTIILKHYAGGMSGQALANNGYGSKSGINDFLRAFEACDKLSYPLPQGITNYGIAELVYGTDLTGGRDTSFEYPDYAAVHTAMTGKKNMTMLTQWDRYRKRCESEGKKAYSYRQFCANYEIWCDTNEESLHFPAVPGEKMEVDFAGKTFPLVDPQTGEILVIVVFVAVLRYSQYIYAEGMISTKEPQWIAVNNRAIKAFGGVPAVVVCDNCKQAVVANQDWIAPELNKDYAEWAEHNGTVILPAQVRKPRWKGSVEGAVGILEKGIFHILEERKYFSLDAFNRDLWKEVDELNHKPFKKKPHDRYYYWIEEKEALLQLPEYEYEYMDRKIVKVSPDFHIRFDNAYYSVDKRYVHKQVLVGATETTIRISSMQGELLVEWPRAKGKGQWSTDPKHLPANYQDMAEWNSAYFLRRALTIGPNTVEVIKRLLKSRSLEVQSYRVCLGVLNFSGKYSKQALENCCKGALESGHVNYTTIKNTIAAYAEELGQVGYSTRINEERNKGAFVMSSEASDLETLLSRSKTLAASQKGGDR